MIKQGAAFFKMSQATMDNRLSGYLREVTAEGKRPSHATIFEIQHVAELYHLKDTLVLVNKVIEAVHS